jgi:ABC-type Fe3+/spermidine/putrescine transport system ATPase subunit
MNPNSELRLENLRKRIEDFTLSAQFSLKNGERAALIGKSGSGKTTLLRMIAGLDSQDFGQVWLGGEDITRQPPQKRQIGYVFQEAALFPSLDVLGNAIFGLLRQGVPRREAEKLGLEWLDKVGLSKKARSPIAHLSGGEAQRVAFVRALIWKPRLILLDEPFSALDAELRQGLRSELLKLHEQWPVPLLLVSHDAQDLEELATVRLRLQEGSGESGSSSERIVMRDGMSL